MYLGSAGQRRGTCFEIGRELTIDIQQTGRRLPARLWWSGVREIRRSSTADRRWRRRGDRGRSARPRRRRRPGGPTTTRTPCRPSPPTTTCDPSVRIPWPLHVPRWPDAVGVCQRATLESASARRHAAVAAENTTGTRTRAAAGTLIYNRHIACSAADTPLDTFGAARSRAVYVVYRVVWKSIFLLFFGGTHFRAPCIFSSGGAKGVSKKGPVHDTNFASSEARALCDFCKGGG